MWPFSSTGGGGFQARSRRGRAGGQPDASQPPAQDLSGPPAFTPAQQPPAYPAGGSGYGKAGKAPINLRVALVVFPLVTFVMTAVSCTFVWSEPILAVSFSLMALANSIRKGAPPSTWGGPHGLPFESLMAIYSSLMALVAGGVTGAYAYEAYGQPFLAVTLGRSYDNVLASFPGAAYADGGQFRFASSSTVDTSKALGYRDIQTYCVAPIIDSGETQIRRVSFWAVGIDCCGWRGDFRCHDAGNVGARSAVVAADDGIFSKSKTEYIRAAKQAAAEYDLAVGVNAIFVHWVQDPKQVQWTNFVKALGVDALGAGGFSLVALASMAYAQARAGGTGASPSPV